MPKKTHSWPLAKFGDCVKNVMQTEKKPLEKGLEYFIGLDDLDGDDLQVKRWGEIAEGTTFTKKMKKGQLLFAKRRVYQHKAAVAPFDGICSGDILVFEANPEKLIPELLPFIVQSDNFFDYAVETSAGSLSPRTKWQDLAKYEFPLPPKDEQKRIAKILWAVEDCIRKYETSLMETEFFLTRLSNHLFSGNFLGKVKNKDALFSKLPKDWQVFLLSDLVDFKNGINKEKEAFGSGIKFVNIENTFTPTLKLDKLGRVEITKSELAAYTLVKGDIIVVRSSVKLEGVGYPTYFEGCNEPVVFSGFTIRLRQKKSNFIPKYLFYYMRWQLFRNQLLARATVSANSNINQGALSKLRIILPPEKIQTQIIKKIELNLNTIQRNRESIKGTNFFKKQLIKELLNA